MFTSKGITALLVASFFFASSAIFIRFATEASAISLTFFRLLIAALAMILHASARRSLLLLRKRDLMLVAASGSVLSLHFVASIFAVPIFGEIPSAIQVAGYTLILLAVTIVATTNLR